MTGSATGRCSGRPEAAVPGRSVLPDAIRGRRLALVGAGRLGTALATGLRNAGVAITGPHGRAFNGLTAEVVVLCVPDDRIAEAAAALVPGLLVGHCSGATDLSVLQAAAPRGAFSLHPLITATTSGATFDGASAAVAGTSEEAVAVADALAQTLGMTPFSVAEGDRTAYHAAAAMASNFLVTLEWAAARLLRTAGVEPAVLLPLARQALANWATLGPAALTGPVARGDVRTVAAHRAAVAARTPDLLPLFDALASSTASLARVHTQAIADLDTAKGS